MQADILLYNGEIIQVERDFHLDNNALVIKDGIIAAIGPLEDVKEEYQCHESIDLKGQAVAPGFIDAHAHFSMTGLNKTGLPIYQVTSKEELLSCLKKGADSAPQGSLLFGSGYDESIFSERALPHRKELDAITSKHLVWLSRVDCHSCLLNTAALEIIDLPVGMEGIEYFEDGSLSGLLRGLANSYARSRIIKAIPNEKKKKAFHLASQAAQEKGITTIHALEGGDLFPEEDLLLLIEEEERLPLDLVIYYQTTDVHRVVSLGLPRIGGCVMLDGSIGSASAAIEEPFFGDPENQGFLYFSDEELLSFVEKAHRAKLQIATHVIGERAIEQMLRIYEKVLGESPANDARHRLEHFELPAKGHIERAKKLGLIISMQPAFDYFWGGKGKLYEQRLGARHTRMNPLRSVWDRGIIVAGGSDSDVTPLNPILGIHGAVNHSNPLSSLTVLEALRLFTLNNAYAAFEEEKKGGIVEGKEASLVVLNENPLYAPKESIKEIEVKMTLYKGEVVYERP